jgi:hypothetical protein
LTSLLSAAALAQNILILAQEKGLGTFWMIDPKRAKQYLWQPSPAEHLKSPSVFCFALTTILLIRSPDTGLLLDIWS